MTAPSVPYKGQYSLYVHNCVEYCDIHALTLSVVFKDGSEKTLLNPAQVSVTLNQCVCVGFCIDK